MKIQKKGNDKGFTLIELLVVISIIGILTTLVTANLTLAQAKARDSRRKSDLKQISAALEIYYNENNTYPAPGTANGTLNFASSNGLVDSNGNNIYMKTIPKDPKNIAGKNEYFYCVIGSTGPYKKFSLYAKLESANDPEQFCGVSGATDWNTPSSVTCENSSATTCGTGSAGTTGTWSSNINGKTNYVITEQ